jgi:cytochrome c-550 PedF
MGLQASSIVLAEEAVQPVDISTLKPLGEALLEENPYRGDPEAIKVGTSAYAQNCARCHGLQGISGGMTPDLRPMESDKETDKYWLAVTLKGRARNGKVYMQPFKETMSQEAIWAIRTYIESLPKPE